MLKFRKGDTVKVISGRDKGREGKIERLIPSAGKAIIPGINLYKKHVKSSLTQDRKGGIFEVVRPINFGKIILICPNCKKATKVGFLIQNNKKERICKKCKKTI
jgi:large subunit ribosomal protein L24